MRLLLLSGGLDSTCLAYWERPDFALTIDYGQTPAKSEIAASRAISNELGIAHESLTVDLRRFGSGHLAGTPVLPIANQPEWWPYRNQTLITLAAMRFIPFGLKEIMIGCVRTDQHVDGKQRFIQAMDKVLSMQEGNVRLVSPSIKFTTLGLMERVSLPPELVGFTFSCHVAEHPCGECRGCFKHDEAVDQYLAKKGLI